jgi:hypothetical protein
MTKRDFFILIIKMFGLYWFIASVLTLLPGSTVNASYYPGIVAIMWIVLNFIVNLGLLYLLLYKADKVADTLRLWKGFDDDQIIIGDLKGSQIIKLGIIIIGGLLIIQNLPTFLSHSLIAYQGNFMGVEYREDEKFYLLVAGLNVLLGIFLLSGYSKVESILNKSKNDNE